MKPPAAQQDAQQEAQQQPPAGGDGKEKSSVSSLRAQLVALNQMLDDGLLSEPEWKSAREKALTDFHGLSRAAAELRQRGDWGQKGPEERSGLEPDVTPIRPLWREIPSGAEHVPAPPWRGWPERDPRPLPTIQRQRAANALRPTPADFGACAPFTVANGRVWRGLFGAGAVYVRCERGYELRRGVNPERVCILPAEGGAGRTLKIADLTLGRVDSSRGAIDGSIVSLATQPNASARWYPSDDSWAGPEPVCVPATAAEIVRTTNTRIRDHVQCLEGLGAADDTR